MPGITSAYSKSAVLPLPFVNMDPNNLLTLCKCIMHAAEQRNAWGWSSIAITVDHPPLQRQERWFWWPTLSSFRHRHSARRISLLLSFMVLSVPLWPRGTDAPIICTSISHLNDTIYAKNSVVHIVDGRACAKGIHGPSVEFDTTKPSHNFDCIVRSREVH